MLKERLMSLKVGLAYEIIFRPIDSLEQEIEWKMRRSVRAWDD